MITTTRATQSGSSPRTSAIGTTSAPTKTNSTPAVIPEMTLTFATSGGSVDLDFSCAFDVRDDDAGTIQFYLDTVAIPGTIRNIAFTGASGLLGLAPGSIGGLPVALSWRCDSLAAGSHTFDVRWTRSAGTLRAVTTQRMITAVEL